MKDKDTKQEILRIVISLIFIIMILVAVWKLGGYWLSSLRAKWNAEKLAHSVIIMEEPKAEDHSNRKVTSNDEEKTEENKVEIPSAIDFSILQEQNPEIVAWIYSPDTVVNYPIVHSTDNEKYLRADLKQKYSKEGTLFIDAANSGAFTDQNTLIYGHNMKNGSMFAEITKYKDSEYYEAHPVIYLYTDGNRYELQILAGCVIQEDHAIYDLSNDPGSAVNDIYRHSTFTSDIDFTEDDKLVTLSTCSYEYDEARYVVVGKILPDF